MEISKTNRILLGDARCTIEQRVAAKLIDLVLVAIIFLLGKLIWFPLGWLGALAYSGIQDSLGQGQSIGKRIIGLQVLEADSGLPCSVWRSVLRNTPLLLSVFFLPIPVLGILMQFIFIPILALEFYILFTLDSGVRLGDVMGNTFVAEFHEELDALPR